MIDIDELRACIARKGMTQKQLAKIIGVSEQTFTRRMRTGVFGTDEASKLIEILNIKNPTEIFLSNK